MPAETLIHRATTRATCADEADAARLRDILPGVVAQLPVLIDALLPDALAAAGLPSGASVAIRRLIVKVDIRGDSPPQDLVEDLAKAWARAIRDALVAQLSSTATVSEPQDDDCLHPDEWRADMAVLAALARGDARPWWARDESAAAILARWVDADPGRAAAMLVELLLATPKGAGAGAAMRLPLSDSEAVALSRGLAARLQARLAELAPQSGIAGPAPGSSPPARTRTPALPPEVNERLVQLAPGTAQLFAQAARMVFAQTQGSTPTLSTEPALGEPLPLAEVFGGGLLMLLRPLIGLMSAGDITPDRLGAIGRAALRRCLDPLPATARRLALERDRWLLAIFAGAPQPDVPLDRLPADPAADAWIDRLAETVPEADWAPAAVRRVYGGAEPFVQAPEQSRLARLVMRPGLLIRTRWSAELIWPLEAADLALRRSGWDLDPGWVPWVGRTIAFRFGDER